MIVFLSLLSHLKLKKKQPKNRFFKHSIFSPQTIFPNYRHYSGVFILIACFIITKGIQPVVFPS